MTTEEYIASQAAEVRPCLQELAGAIRAAAPAVTERRSYGMPCFYLGKAFLCGFGVFKKHIGFYPGGEPVGVFADRLTAYRTSKGAVQFPIGRPIDLSLVADMVKWRVEHG